jgi:hypothetical protein
MKYFITESKLENVINKYLDLKDFVILNTSDSYRFYSSRQAVDDEFSLITYDKRYKDCFISSLLGEEVCSLFSLQPDNALSIISDWVENKLGVEVESYNSDFGAD